MGNGSSTDGGEEGGRVTELYNHDNHNIQERQYETESDDSDNDNVIDLTPGKLVTRASLRQSKDSDNEEDSIQNQNQNVSTSNGGGGYANANQSIVSVKKRKSKKTNNANLPKSPILPPPDDGHAASVDHEEHEGFLEFAVNFIS